MREEKQSKGLIILVFLISYAFIGNMLAVYSTVLPYRDWIRLIVSITGCFMLFFLLCNNRVSRKNVLLVQLLFILSTIIPTFYRNYTTATVQYAVLQVADSLLWIGVFAWAYYVAFKKHYFIEKISWIALFIPVYSLLFLGVKQFSAGRGIPLISTAYYALFLLPFAFMINNKWVRWILVYFSFSTVLLSVKRTGFIAFIICIIVFCYYDIRYGGEEKHYSKRKIKMIFGAIVLAIGLYVFFDYYTSTHSIDILMKLSSIKQDGGSGRTDVWLTTWNMIKDSDFMSTLFGHGFNAVYEDSILKLSAHTDFLEVLYDYGILGFVLYIGFWKNLFRYFNKVKLYRPTLVAPYAVSMVLMICMSAVAHLIIYPTHFLFLCLFWGLIFGEMDQETVVRR